MIFILLIFLSTHNFIDILSTQKGNGLKSHITNSFLIVFVTFIQLDRQNVKVDVENNHFLFTIESEFLLYFVYF